MELQSGDAQLAVDRDAHTAVVLPVADHPGLRGRRIERQAVVDLDRKDFGDHLPDGLGVVRQRTCREVDVPRRPAGVEGSEKRSNNPSTSAAPAAVVDAGAPVAAEPSRAHALAEPDRGMSRR